MTRFDTIKKRYDQRQLTASAGEPLLGQQTKQRSHVAGRIKVQREQMALPPLKYATQLLSKHPLRQQHDQQDQKTFFCLLIKLEVKGYANPHATSFQRPPKVKPRGLVALSATCAQESRTALYLSPQTNATHRKKALSEYRRATR